MPEPYAVLCTCGYTTLVPGSAFGTSVECANCGAELEVDESSSAPGRPVEDSAPVDGEYDRGLPESPLVVHSPIETGPKEGPASPFEDESERSEIRPQEAKHTPSPPPARSPFEAEDEETEEGPPRGPFTLEPAPESGDVSFAERIEAERPKEGKRHVIIQTESPLDNRTGEKCSECGREIRGDWDRFEAAEGVICYVCSNQATHGLPERLRTAPDRRELSEQDLIIDQVQPVEKPEPPWYFNPESGGFRRLLWTLAIGTLLLGVYVSLFDESQPPPGQVQTLREVYDDIALMPNWARGVLQAWSVLSVFLSGLIATYLVLKWYEWLPHGVFFRDLLYTGTILVALTFMHFLFVAMGAFVGQIPMFGSIMSVLLPLARLMIAALVLSTFLDMRIKHILLTFVLYFLFTRFVFAMIGVFVYRALSAVT